MEAEYRETIKKQIDDIKDEGALKAIVLFIFYLTKKKDENITPPFTDPSLAGK